MFLAAAWSDDSTPSFSSSFSLGSYFASSLQGRIFRLLNRVGSIPFQNPKVARAVRKGILGKARLQESISSFFSFSLVKVALPPERHFRTLGNRLCRP